MTTDHVGTINSELMVEAPLSIDRIRRAYDLYSHFYIQLAVPLERRPRMRGLDAAGIGSRDTVLEVAVGPGAALLEILKRVGKETTVYGVDLSPKMLTKARRVVQAAGYTNVDLREADTRHLPFPDGTFDVLYNSYMLDLMPVEDMPLILGEFRRVLKPGGRLSLVNFSKKDWGRRNWYERLYTALPTRWVPYLLGGCRPVFMEGLVREAGFTDVRQEFVPNVIPAEVVTARKPSA